MMESLYRLGEATRLRGIVATLFARGVIAILFGLTVFFWSPFTEHTLAALLEGTLASSFVGTLATLFAWFVLLDGLLALLLAGADLTQRVPPWGHLGEGALGLTIALVTFSRPSVTSLEVLYLIVLWALILGILEIATAFWTREALRESWLTFVNGVIALLFALILLIQASTGALASTRLIVFYALVLGTLHITRAVRIYLGRDAARSAPHEAIDLGSTGVSYEADEDA
jgi:uncharacterized membrane protein HdeD (DUF308 family)